jgi:hypothetical protein
LTSYFFRVEVASPASDGTYRGSESLLLEPPPEAPVPAVAAPVSMRFAGRGRLALRIGPIDATASTAPPNIRRKPTALSHRRPLVADNDVMPTPTTSSTSPIANTVTPSTKRRRLDSCL